MKRKKRLIEIYTSNKKWITVELIRFIKFNLLLIKLDNGQIIRRKADRWRYLVRRIASPKLTVSEEAPKHKKIKKVRKKKKFSKPAYVLAEYKKDMADWKKKFYSRRKRNVSDNRAN
jgi:hypothetical protein